MIPLDDYIKAKQIVQQYEFEQDEIKKQINQEKAIELAVEQAKCEHYYISSGGKWSSATQMTCIYCNKTINS